MQIGYGRAVSDDQVTSSRARTSAPVGRPTPDVVPSTETARGEGGSRWDLLRVLLAAMVGVGLVELMGFGIVQERRVLPSDWEAAAARVRELAGPEDGIVVAPDWATPVAYAALGDEMTTRRAAPADLASFERVFEISARGFRHRDLRGRREEETERIGRLTLRRYDLGPSPVVYDLVDHVRHAEVSLVPLGSDGERGEAQSCPFTEGRPGRGGLGAGPLMPAARHACVRARPWVYVGETVLEDLDLRPRRCVWQHPEAGAEVVAAFDDVPLDTRLVLHAGLYYEHERMREHGPFVLRVRAEGREVGLMTHRDGDGWKRIEASLPGAEGERGRVEIAVHADNPHLRSVCWAADLRRGPRRGARGVVALASSRRGAP